MDLLDGAAQEELATTLPSGLDYVFISALGSQGLAALKDKVWQLLHPA